MMLPVMASADVFTFDILRGPGSGSGGGYVPPVIGAQVNDWGYDYIGGDLARAGASGMVQVAVLDTGIDTDHVDLNPVWCYNEIDDVEGCAAVEDSDGHGTHTSGTISALDNEVGIVGIAAGFVELYVIQILGGNGGDWYDLGDAIIRAASGPDGIEGNADDAEVISMSVGGDISLAPSIIADLQVAIDYAWNAGTVLVASAGNEGDGDSSTTEHPQPDPAPRP